MSVLTPLGPKDSPLVQILNFSEFNLPHFIEPSVSEVWTLLWLERGELSLELEGQYIGLDAKALILLAPETEVKVLGRCFSGRLLQFRGEVLQEAGLGGGCFAWRTGSYFQGALGGEVVAIWAQLWQLIACRYDLDPQHPSLKAYLQVFLLELRSLLQLSSSADAWSVKVGHFERLVERDFRQHRLPSHYAKALFLSENYLNRLCKKFRGQTAGQLIRGRVEREARKLLCQTQDSVAEIAYALGFESPSYFTAFFKREVGLAPEVYRQNQMPKNKPKLDNL